MKRGTKRKFGRTNVQRNAFLKALATALISHGKIKTTHARAQTLSQYTDKLITRAKHQDLHSRKLLLRTLNPAIARTLIEEIAPRFTDRRGGYTRIVPLGRRQSDGADMSLIEFTA